MYGGDSCVLSEYLFLWDYAVTYVVMDAIMLLLCDNVSEDAMVLLLDDMLFDVSEDTLILLCCGVVCNLCYGEKGGSSFF